MPTSQLWNAAHDALVAGRWSDARRALDELGRRSDNTDMLAQATAYGVPAELQQLIQDRIDLVNSKADMLASYCARCDCSVAEALSGR